ncbi:hypothetical protein, partial [Enterobacter bugandensis]|uniref:hypothetical protein n=2 Tax=Enterobacter TaxID=547 RepID=UPI003D6F87FE
VDPWGGSCECIGKTKPDFYVGPATPRMFVDRPRAPLEPFTKAYPEYGQGNVQQLHAENRVINFDKIDILP